MKALEQARSTGKLVAAPLVGVPYAVPPGCGGVGVAGGVGLLHRDAQGRRPPLSRTHSAPLPLGGHLLNQSLLLQQEALLAENKKLYLKQVSRKQSVAAEGCSRREYIFTVSHVGGLVRSTTPQQQRGLDRLVPCVAAHPVSSIIALGQQEPHGERGRGGRGAAARGDARRRRRERRGRRHHREPARRGHHHAPQPDQLQRQVGRGTTLRPHTGVYVAVPCRACYVACCLVLQTSIPGPAEGATAGAAAYGIGWLPAGGGRLGHAARRRRARAAPQTPDARAVEPRRGWWGRRRRRALLVPATSSAHGGASPGCALGQTQIHHRYVNWCEKCLGPGECHLPLELAHCTPAFGCNP